MNLKKALCMALFLALGGLYLLRFEGERAAEQVSGREDGGPEKSILLFPDIHPEQIQRISVVQASGSYAVERSGFVAATQDSPMKIAADAAPWIVRHPQGAAADGARVQKMINVLLDTVARNTLQASDMEQNQSAYGLVPPELVLTLEGSFDKRVLSFGKKIALTGRRYAQPEKDSRLFVVEDGVFTTLALSAEDVRDHYPVKFQIEKVREFSLVRSEAAPLNFVRDNATTPWRLVGEEGGFVVDQELINKKLESLQKLKVAHFVDEPGETIALYGLRVPKVSASLRLEVDPAEAQKRSGSEQLSDVGTLNSRPDQLVIQFGEGVDAKSLQTLREGNPSDGDRRTEEIGTGHPAAGDENSLADVEGKKRIGYYFRLAGSPYIYQASRPIYGDFLQPAEFYRPRKPYRDLMPGEISRIEFLPGKAEEGFTVSRDSKGGWSLRKKNKENDSDETRPVSEEAVLSWFRSFQEFSVISYQNQAERGNSANGFTEPEFSIFVYRDGTQAPLRIVFGKQVGVNKVPSEGGLEEKQVPRWVAVSQPDGAFLPAFSGASEFESIKRQKSDFLK